MPLFSCPIYCPIYYFPKILKELENLVFKSGKRRRSLKSGESRLKVVIMSATMDVDHFSKYFKFGFHGIFFFIFISDYIPKFSMYLKFKF